jgi:precorrin-6B methylase 2
MNSNILEKEVQAYINVHLSSDASKIALGKSPFPKVSSAELANQITAKKKSEKKLPTWFNQALVYYPSALSIEQTSSEEAARFKQTLIKGETLIDITAGFGVDSYFFAQKVKEVYACEINPELSTISAHNAKVLGANNITCIATDGLAFLKTSELKFDAIYIDPARRNNSGKVFKLADCTPNIIEHLDLLLDKSEKIIIKTSPLLDLQAGLQELRNVSEIYIVSIKNECKELLWIIEKDFVGVPHISCVTINDQTKLWRFSLSAIKIKVSPAKITPEGYLYEPDVALMKSGAFDWIAQMFDLHKISVQSHLYFANQVKHKFMGRIFKIMSVMDLNELKKEKHLKGNVIVRNFPDKAESLAKKYKITSSQSDFLIFTQIYSGYIVIKAQILQYY